MKMKIGITVGRRFGKGKNAIYYLYDGDFKSKNDHKLRSHGLKAISNITQPRKAKIETLFTAEDKLSILLTVDKQSVDFWFEGVKPGFSSPLVQGRKKGKFSPWRSAITVN